MAEILEHVIVFFLGIFNGYMLWDTIATDDVLPEKILDGCRACVCDGLRLNPFFEVPNFYNSEGIIALSWG
jgi:hypothetical protein